jgi:hypothetical protein
MKDIIWNAGGFRDPTKHPVVHETIREHRLDFFIVIETRRELFYVPFINNSSDILEYVSYFYLYSQIQGYLSEVQFTNFKF